MRRAVMAVGLVMASALQFGCAPRVQAGMTPPAVEAQGPRFLEDGFISFDGARLGLSAWMPSAEPWAVIVALHGMNDYGEAFYLAGPHWAAHGVATYAYDARGFGRSPGRGLWPGQDLMEADLRAAIAAARARHPGAVVAVVGDSMGAAAALTAFGSPDPPAADRLVLAAPAVWGWSALPVAYAATLWAGARLAPGVRLTPPRNLDITPSDNIAMLRKISRDPLMVFGTRIDALYGLVSLMEEGAARAGQVRAPTAFLYGAKDEIIPRAAVRRVLGRLPPNVRTALYPDGYHMLLRDLEAQTVWDDVLSFLRDPAAPFPSGAPPLTAPALQSPQAKS